MLHRKLVEPVLADLEGEVSEYWGRVMQRVDEDRRLEPISNLVFLLLRETIPHLPTYLPAPEFSATLFEFVIKNRRKISMAIFDRSYIEGPDGPERLQLITNDFVAVVLEKTLEKYDDGEIEEESQKIYRFSSDDDDIDFPYRDLDAEEDQDL